MLSSSDGSWEGWWCGAEWPSDEKRDLGGISWHGRTMAAGEDLGRGLPLDPAEQPASQLACSIIPARCNQTRRAMAQALVHLGRALAGGLQTGTGAATPIGCYRAANQ